MKRSTLKLSVPRKLSPPWGSRAALLLLALTVFLSQPVLPQAALSQAGPPRLTRNGPSNSQYPLGIPPAVKPRAWLTQAWTGDDAPYVRMEREICGKIHAGRPAQTVLAQARAEATEYPLDFAPQVRWLYASTQAASRTVDIDWRAIDAVAREDPGNLRAVARIRFAAGVMIDPNEGHPDLDRLGERLLRADPNDRWVRLHLVYDLASSRPSLPKAETMARAFVQKEPQNASAHSALAFVEETFWVVSGHRRVYAVGAIAEYKAFLRLAPPNDPFRHDAQYLVQGFTRRLASSIP